MSYRKLIVLIAALCASGPGRTVLAADGFPSINASHFLPLQATMRGEAIIGVQQVRRTYVTAGTNMFAFCVPDTFRLDASNPSKVVLMQEEYKCFLAFRIRAPQTEGQPPSFREQIVEEYPGAKILGEFAQNAGHHNGSAFDIQWTNSNRVAQSARVVFVESPIGIVEFILVSPSDNFAGSKRFFDFLRFSYCSDEGGPIKPILTPTESPRS